MSSFGDTELNLSGKGRNHLDFDYYLSTSLAPSWKDGSGSRISPDSPSALETRKESWGVMDMGQSTQQYLAQSTHIPKAAWLSVTTCPLLSVCPWHLGSALLTWPLLGDHPAKFSLQNSQGARCWPYTIWPVRKHHFIPQPWCTSHERAKMLTF